MDLVGYLSNGYPSRSGTLKNAKNYIEGGIDILEIDLPSDNPYIDGEAIQTRMKSSFKKDPTLQSQVDTILEIRKRFPNQRIFLLAYEETILNLGLKKFVNLYTKVGAEALILVAMKDNEVKNKLMENNVMIVNYVEYHLPDNQLEDAKNTNGFIYLQAKPSVKYQPKFNSLKENIDYLRNELKIEQPIYCGVGISTPEDIKYVKAAGADGAFVGSGILNREDNPKDLIDYIKMLKRNI